MGNAQRTPVVLATDRGGHLHNARMLFEGIGLAPDAVLTTPGPELGPLQRDGSSVYALPYLFTWFGKLRIPNPFRFLYAFAVAARLAWKLRPQHVVSLGASDVVPFCYFAWLFGAQIHHVECMNQVENPSVTGRMLYPICRGLYVQWPELLKAYGPKAKYEGWVLG